MNQRTSPFVKVCGLSRIADIRTAERYGAEYIGLITEVTRSPRCLSRDQAALLARAARAKPTMVTTSTDAREIVELAGFVQPAAVQLHGTSAPIGPVAEALDGIEVWQVVSVPVDQEPDPEQIGEAVRAAVVAGADKVVVDSSKAGASGGTGVAMRWEIAAQAVRAAGDTPVVLAGGLTPENVAEAVGAVGPAGVDVSSGVETAPNVKSPHLIRALMEAVFGVTDC